MKRKEKPERIFVILLSLFVVMLGYGILLPVLPYYTERLVLSGKLDPNSINFHIGMLTSIYPFFQLIFIVIWGKLSDKYGRKPIIIFGLIGFIIMQIWTGLATSLTMLYLARIFGGIFTSSVIPVSNAYLSDLSSVERRTKVMAWSGVAISSGVIIGPAVGGFLSQTDFRLTSYFTLDRFSVPFLFAALLGVIVLLIVKRFLKVTVKVQNFPVEKINLRLVFTQYFVVLLILTFVLQFVVTLFETVFSIYGKVELGLNSNQVAIGFILCGSVMAVLQPVFATYAEKLMSAKKLIALGMFISGLTLLAFPFFTNELVIYGLIVVFAAGGALVTPNLLSAVSLISDRNTGRNLSIQTSFGSVGQIAGPILGTWLIAGGFKFPFIIGGIIALSSIVLLYYFNQNKDATSQL